MNEAEERARREKHNDSLVNEVHNNHRLSPGTESVERERLLQHYIQLPDDPKYDSVKSQVQRPPGEILATLYNHTLRLDIEEDDQNDDVGRGNSHSRSRPAARRLSGENQTEPPTCTAVPLQWLYNIPNDRTPPTMVDSTELFSYLPPGLTDGGDGSLRVIEFPTPYYADSFLKMMKDNLSLETLINESGAAIEKVKSSSTSDFLQGITYYPNNPPRQFVSPIRLFYPRETVIFTAIPYLGQETSPKALFRKNLQSFPAAPPKGEIAKTLTAYHFVDKAAVDVPPSNSSLNLLEYKFPSKSETDFKELQKELDPNPGGELELTVVHQVWFMVFGNETIAAFRSADDVESDKLPLLPWQRQTTGAYHALINMISHILPLAETKILKKFSQEISDFEFLVQTRPAGEGSASKMKVMDFELSSAINIVKAQIDILRSLGQFNVDENPEQFELLRETVEATVGARCLIFQRLQDMQKTLKECLSGVHRKTVSEQFEKVREAAEASKTAAEAGKAAAEASKEAAEQGKTAAEASKLAAEASKAAADDAKKAAEASQHAAQESKDASRQTTEMAQAGIRASEGNAEQTKGQSINISIFTLITAVFTPMSSTTSYWGMNVQDIRQTSWSQREYWELTAPLTVFILFIGWLVGFSRPERFRPIIPKRFHHRIYERRRQNSDPEPKGSASQLSISNNSQPSMIPLTPSGVGYESQLDSTVSNSPTPQTEQSPREMAISR